MDFTYTDYEKFFGITIRNQIFMKVYCALLIMEIFIDIGI